MATATTYIGTHPAERPEVEAAPGVAELDRGPIEGDDLDELYWRNDHGVNKLRCTSTDRDLALDLVETKYYQIKNNR
jgi:hypothetical protein